MSSDLLAQALTLAGNEIGDKATALIVSNLRLQATEAQLAVVTAHNAAQAARIDEDAELVKVLREDRNKIAAERDRLKRAADAKPRKTRT